MIWIASFPRSGNTFLRNILFEVFGLVSSTYHHETAYPVDEDFASYPFVKTHLRPAELDAAGFDPSLPAVYLVRDGRDAICSIAHHRTDLVAPGSDFLSNMAEAIIAERDSYFGGWSTNVEEWVARAALVIRYEDLVAAPLVQTRRIGALIELPPARAERLPTFDAMKLGIPEYGAGKHLDWSEETKRENARKFFRRGQAGAWRDEMPADLQDLFWSFHGETMARLGYDRHGGITPPHPDLDLDLAIKLGATPPVPRRKYRVLMEAAKLVSKDNDGIKRYQVELLKALYPAVTNPLSRWQLDLYHHGHVTPMSQFGAVIFDSDVAREMRLPGRSGPRQPTTSAAAVDDGALQAAQVVGAVAKVDAAEELYESRARDAVAGTLCVEPPHPNPFIRLERRVMSAVPRSFVQFLQRRNITLLHDVYESFRALVVALADRGSPLMERAREWLSYAQVQLRQAHDKDISGYDLVHIPLLQHFAPFKKGRTRKVITIHDLTHLHFPDLHTAVNVRNAKRGMAFAEQSSAELIAVSAATRDDLLSNTSVPAERVKLIYEAADPKLFHLKLNREDRDRVREKYGIQIGVPYIVSLSTLEPRKNLENSIRAFLALLQEHPELEVNLVIAGKRGWDYAGIYRLAEARADRIHFTGFVDDQDLAYLYSDALCLSYLSFYEGFGLPPLEAMRCGTPVIFGSNSSLREVVGDAGLPADPHDVEDICQQYLRLLNDGDLRQRLGRAALRRSNDFSWRKAAIETLALYESVINARAQPMQTKV